MLPRIWASGWLAVPTVVILTTHSHVSYRHDINYPCLVGYGGKLPTLHSLPAQCRIFVLSISQLFNVQFIVHYGLCPGPVVCEVLLMGHVRHTAICLAKRHVRGIIDNFTS